MAKMLWVFLGGLVVGSIASLTMAADRPSVVYSTAVRYVHPDGLSNSAYRVVQRKIVEPAAVVHRDLATQPTWADKIELQVADTTVYLDPHDADLQMKLRRLGRGHSFIKAVEMWAGSHGQTPTRVVYGPRYQEPRTGRVIRPLFIIQKPDTRLDGNPVPMPTTPKAIEPDEQEGKAPAKVAMAQTH